MKCIVVGAGLSGATAAHLLHSNGHDVEIFETRKRIGGNCYDESYNDIMIHHFGPHAFHTNDSLIWKFINKFDDFLDIKLVVKARVQSGHIIDIPFNHNSQKIVGKWNDKEIIKNIFIPYSEKQWGIPWNKIPKNITSRLKIRRDSNVDLYHLDKYQGIPRYGYTHLISNMLDGCKVHTSCRHDAWKKYRADLMIYTGSIDEYYQYSYGPLSYRSLNITFQESNKTPYMQLNECNDISYTRTIDHSYWNYNKCKKTILTKEYPEDFSIHNQCTERFYPKPHISQDLYNKYKQIPSSKTVFLGRLGTYKYLNMDVCIKQVMKKIQKFI
jgi:UDP-galactopyranose mutase